MEIFRNLFQIHGFPKVNNVNNHLIGKLLRETKMILISIMQQDKIVFLMLERKIKTEGATRSQRCTSNVEYIRHSKKRS